MICSKVRIVHDHAVTTTGGEVWKAANVLVVFLSSLIIDASTCSTSDSTMTTTTTTRKLKILELGSGCGFAALELARRHSDRIESIVCTEQANGLSHLQRNIDLNSDCDWSKLVTARCFDWSDNIEQSEFFVSNEFDFVIGSDLVYSDIGLALLVNVFAQFEKRFANHRCRFIYVHTLHRFDIMDHDFFNALVKIGLDYRELELRKVDENDAVLIDELQTQRRNSRGPCLMSFGDERVAVFEIFKPSLSSVGVCHPRRTVVDD